MLRGINRQQIFKDREDYEKFLSALNDVKLIGSFKLYAYCLMGNHIHLLIKEKRKGLDQIFRKIRSRFVYWYNVKYDREGHLFQDRYKVESVDSEEYLFTVLRYIHQNPVKASLCETVDEYEFSSYSEFISGQNIVDTGDIFAAMNR
ncbi:MAG: transposase [Clostridia bacterium]|nr:transposase [Clostridia bacterium]